jgi:hypothetical protein
MTFFRDAAFRVAVRFFVLRALDCCLRRFGGFLTAGCCEPLTASTTVSPAARAAFAAAAVATNFAPSIPTLAASLRTSPAVVMMLFFAMDQPPACIGSFAGK